MPPAQDGTGSGTSRHAAAENIPAHSSTVPSGPGNPDTEANKLEMDTLPPPDAIPGAHQQKEVRDWKPLLHIHPIKSSKPKKKIYGLLSLIELPAQSIHHPWLLFQLQKSLSLKLCSNPRCSLCRRIYPKFITEWIAWKRGQMHWKKTCDYAKAHNELLDTHDRRKSTILR